MFCWCFERRVVLKFRADPDRLSSVANLLMDNSDALSTKVSSASVGEP